MKIKFEDLEIYVFHYGGIPELRARVKTSSLTQYNIGNDFNTQGRGTGTLVILEPDGRVSFDYLSFGEWIAKVGLVEAEIAFNKAMEVLDEDFSPESLEKGKRWMEAHSLSSLLEKADGLSK